MIQALLTYSSQLVIKHYIILIIDDYAIFLDKFHKDLPKGIEMHRSKTGTYYYTNCSDPSVFSDLDLQIDDHLYKIPASMYLECLKDLCYSRISEKKGNFWVLGIVFLQM